ncbi:MAG: hypothetical protein KBF88_14195 [Polyangiaceae bacterium]|nr:hypothetical protein [Polyangiaceae bacterium]
MGRPLLVSALTFVQTPVMLPADIPVHGNLGDPEYEPSDEELRGLMRRAFANVASEHEAAVKQIHDEIRRRREQAKAR